MHHLTQVLPEDEVVRRQLLAQMLHLCENGHIEFICTRFKLNLIVLRVHIVCRSNLYDVIR